MADYTIACVNEDKRPLVGVVVEAVSLDSFPDISATGTTKLNGTVQFLGLTGAHWFRPRVRRSSTTVGGRVFVGRVDVQVIQSDVTIPCIYDFVVDPDGRGTNLTLSGASGAFQEALTAGGNKVIWMCPGSSETFSAEEDIGGIDGIITIAGPSTIQELGSSTIANAARVVLTAGANLNLFKQDSNQTGSDKGLVFKGIGLSLGPSYAVLLVTINATNEIRTLEFSECTFDDGYLLQNTTGIISFGNVRLRLLNCGGTLNALWANNLASGNVGPDQFLSNGSVITLTNWFDNAGTGASPDIWETRDDQWTVSNGMTMRDSPFSISNTVIFYSGSTALFSTPGSGTGSTSQKDFVFTDLIIRFTHADGVFGDFQSGAANNLEGLFIDGVYGYPSGVTPTGTFLTIDDPDFLKVYVGDFFGRDFPTQYSGPVEVGFNPGESIFLVAKSGAYTITAADGLVVADASGGAFTVTLPAAADFTGRVYRIKKIDSSANAVTIDGNGSETIDGATTAVLSTQYEAITVVSDGTEWWVL